MKKTLLVLLVAILSMSACSKKHCALKNEEAPRKKISAEEMQAAWEKVSTPGEAHTRLNQVVGEWNTKARFWMEPGKAPEESAGSASHKWVLNGRFIQENYEGTSMGKPFQGLGLIGYDNAKEEYVSIWTDSMSTALMSSTGTYDAKTNSITYKGAYYCPVRDAKADTRAVVNFIDNNKYVFEMYESAMGREERKVLDIIYTRK